MNKSFVLNFFFDVLNAQDVMIVNIVVSLLNSFPVFTGRVFVDSLISQNISVPLFFWFAVAEKRRENMVGHFDKVKKRSTSIFGQ